MIRSTAEQPKFPAPSDRLTPLVAQVNLGTSFLESANLSNGVIDLANLKAAYGTSRKWKVLNKIIDEAHWDESLAIFFGKLLLLLLEKRLHELSSQLASKDAPINFNCRTEKGGYSALHLSIRYDAPLELIALLIDKGSAINVQDHKGQTPLYLAVNIERAALVAILIKAGGDLSIKSNDGWTVVYMASLNKHSDLRFDAILDNAPASNDDKANFGGALYWIIKSKAYRTALKIFKLRRVICFSPYCNLLVDAISQTTPLELIRIMIDRKVPQLKYEKITPMQAAITHDRPDIVALLIERRASLRKIKLSEMVKSAARAQSFTCLEAILDNAPAALLNEAGEESLGQALLEVLHYRQFPLARKILNSHKANISNQTTEGLQPLHLAVLWNAPLDIVAKLVKRGADINAKDNNGSTPLSLAKRNGMHLTKDVLVNPQNANINEIAVQAFFHMHYLGHWAISTLPVELICHIACFLVQQERLEELIENASKSANSTLKEWWQTRTVAVEDKQKYYWYLRNEFGNVPKGVEEALNVLTSIKELDFSTKVDNLLFGSAEKEQFRIQQIVKLSRLLIYRKQASPLAYYLRGVFGPNGIDYLKIALVLDDQEGEWKLSAEQRADLEFRLASINSDFPDWTNIVAI
jgi:ankyrin repeat protein